MAKTVDIQNERPENEISLERVGVEGFKKCVLLKERDEIYHTIVTVNCYVALPPNLRGVHMSRFAESIEEASGGVLSIVDFVECISERAFKKHGFHSFTEVFCELPFERLRPGGEKENYVVQVSAKYSSKSQVKKIGITINGVLACPCSKEMCNGLTHNQRGAMSVEIDVSKQKIDFYDIVNTCYNSFSSRTYSLLKRPEEKEIVEKIHQNPRFVEDVVRKCVQLLKEQYPGRHCSVKCVSFESIHDYNVCCEWSGIL